MTGRQPPGIARRGRRGWPVLAWAAAAFVATQLAVTAGADGFAPELYDAEYAARIDRLRRQRQAHPDRALLVVLGSSRAAMAFRPERVPPLSVADGRGVLPFNFAHMGAGPVFARMTYDRLVREGLSPDWVVLELTPAFLTGEWKAVYTRAAAASDLPLLCRYTPARRVYGDYVRTRLVPAHSLRRAVLGRFLPDWLTPDPTDPAHNLDDLGGERGRMVRSLSPAEVEQNFARNRAGFGPTLAAFRVTGTADRAVRDLAAACRARGVPLAVLLAPEAGPFRALYPPAARAALDLYLRTLATEPGVRVIDARTWLPDDVFTDGHHVTQRGQDLFTDRFSTDVVTPLVSGR